MIHLPVKSLTELCPVQQTHYNQYALLKEQAAPIVRKDGFIALKEIQNIADANGESKGNLQKKIRRLVDAGFVQKSKHGVVMTSKRTIHKNLNLYYKKKNGKEHTPFIKLDNIHSTYQFDLIRLYLLMKQIRDRYLYQKNGRTNRKLGKTAPEYFELSLDKICERGKYKSKMTVNRMIDGLVRLGLLERIKGLMNNTKIGHYDCNKYLIWNKPLSKINWGLLDCPKEIDWKALFKSLPDKPNTRLKVKRGTRRSAIKTEKTEPNEIQKKFIWFMESGCQDILVDNGILTKLYHSFGMKRGRRISISMIPRILTEILNDTQLREIFFTVFKPSDVMVFDKAEGSFYNSNLSIPRYRALNSFQYHHVKFVTDGTGNCSDYYDVELRSKQSIKDQLFLNSLTYGSDYRVTSI